MQAKWLAPTDTYVELGMEAGRGAAPPGNDRNKNGVGAGAVFALGNDIGSWAPALIIPAAAASDPSRMATW